MAVFDLARFSIREMTECGRALRRFGDGAASMEDVANRVVGFLYDHLYDSPASRSACALVRMFKTHPFAQLPPDLQEAAKEIVHGIGGKGDLQCLTLLATQGAEPAWQTRQASIGHKAIPLVSEQFVNDVPMISNLVGQLGLELAAVIRPRADLFLNASNKKYNVFYVPNAIGSPVIPAQDSFVVPFGVRSVIGFGGVLPSGSVFAVILFLRVEVSRQVADLFQTIALDVKVALLPFEEKVFS